MDLMGLRTGDVLGTGVVGFAVDDAAECNCPLADFGPNLIDCQHRPNCALTPIERGQES